MVVQKIRTKRKAQRNKSRSRRKERTNRKRNNRKRTNRKRTNRKRNNNTRTFKKERKITKRNPKIQSGGFIDKITSNLQFFLALDEIDFLPSTNILEKNYKHYLRMIDYITLQEIVNNNPDLKKSPTIQQIFDINKYKLNDGGMVFDYKNIKCDNLVEKNQRNYTLRTLFLYLIECNLFKSTEGVPEEKIVDEIEEDNELIGGAAFEEEDNQEKVIYEPEEKKEGEEGGEDEEGEEEERKEREEKKEGEDPPKEPQPNIDGENQKPIVEDKDKQTGDNEVKVDENRNEVKKDDDIPNPEPVPEVDPEKPEQLGYYVEQQQLSP